MLVSVKTQKEFLSIAAAEKRSMIFFETEKLEQKKNYLIEANNTIDGKRLDSHGTPKNSFALTAQYWQTYLDQIKDRPLNSVDVGNLQILFKAAKIEKLKNRLQIK